MSRFPLPLLLTLLFAALLGGFHQAEAQQVLYVDGNASGTSDGSSWTDAFQTLQPALDKATSMTDPVEIWVAAGTYRPTRRTDSADPRTATFQLVDNVKIYGGFDGTESSRQGRNRDPSTNGTVLSGDIGTAGFSGDNTYHVVTASGVGQTAVLDGVTVTSGRANGPDYLDIDGGGMYSEAGSPTLANCRFLANVAQGDGGGIYNWNGGSPRIRDCIFEQNTAGFGGGAISNGFESSPSVDGVVFSENTADLDGGAVSNFDSSPTFIDVEFKGNVSGYVGGALNNSYNSDPALVNVRFAGNRADGGGGAVANYNSDPTIVNVLMTGNRADDGGAMHNDESSPILTNVTLSGNLADDGFGGGEGGAMSNSNQSFPEIRNSVLWKNNALGSGDALFLDASSEPLVSHSIVQGGLPTGTFDGGHNLVKDPEFEGEIDPASAPTLSGDFRVLTDGAPGLDAADIAALPPDTYDLDGDGIVAEPIPLDIERTNRLVDNNNDGTDTPDMGAYEAPSSVLPVELALFQARVADDAVRLTWQTASETNNAGFDIERRVEEGDWKTLGFVEGAGTRSERTRYSFEDGEFGSGRSTLAYRLRQIDLDGSTRYSEVVRVDLPTPSELRLKVPYPNPAVDQVTVGFALPARTPVTFELYDVMGRRLAVLRKGTLPPGNHEHSLDVAGYSTGLYVLRLSTKQGAETRKINVIR